MRRYDYLIFDFDGTVVDTGEGILKSLQFAFLDQGDRVPDLSDLRKFIGPPIYYSFTAFYGVPEERVADYIKSYRARYRAKGVYECAPYPGMAETLQTLRQRGVKLGIASSKPQTLIYDVMTHLGITDLFDAVVGTADDESQCTAYAEGETEELAPREVFGVEEQSDAEREDRHGGGDDARVDGRGEAESHDVAALVGYDGKHGSNDEQHLVAHGHMLVVACKE